MNRQDSSALANALVTLAGCFRWGVIIILVGLAFSGLRMIKNDEAAVILRFGRLVGSSRQEQVHGPGLLVAFPSVIDRVVVVPVGRVHEVTIDAFAPGLSTLGLIRASGYALTGDGSAVTLRATAKYRIEDPVAWTLAVQNPADIVRGAVTSAIGQAAAGSPVDQLLTTGKKELAEKILSAAQKQLDKLDTGVGLIALEFRAIEPPRETKAAFDAVIDATVNRETAVKEAVQYREQIVPAAVADAAQTVQDAKALASHASAAAKTDLAEFWGVLPQFQTSPLVTSERLWADRVSELLQRMKTTWGLPPDGSPRLLLP